GPACRPGRRPPGAEAPRTWGWTVLDRVLGLPGLGSPTHVGMDRSRSTTTSPDGRKPHARGDGPRPLAPSQRRRAEAPRTWGWTAPRPPSPEGGGGSPTHVGMDRAGGGRRPRRHGKPHARGDGPSSPPGVAELATEAP